MNTLRALTVACALTAAAPAWAQPTPPLRPTKRITKGVPGTTPPPPPAAGTMVVSADALRAILTARAQAVAEKEQQLLVKRDSRSKKSLVRWDAANNALVGLYQSTRDTVQDVSVSADDRYVAVIETKDGVLNADGDYAQPPQNQLVILNGQGQRVLLIEEDVQVYKFSPDGRKLAYVVGTYYEGGVGFTPEGAWVVDLDAPNKPRVQVPDLEHPFDVDWLSGALEPVLYVRTLPGAQAKRPDRLMRYLPDQRRTEAADDPDAFHFSPDGAFYLRQGGRQLEAGLCTARRESECTEVVERTTKRVISVGLSGRVRGWAYGREALLLAEQGKEETAKTQVMDVRAQRVLETFEGVVPRDREASWVASTRQVLVMPARRRAAPDDGMESFILRRVPSRTLLETMAPSAPPTTHSRRAPADASQLLRALYLTRTTSEPNVDRPGSDYFSAWLDAANPSLCETMCLHDARCLAYTYVKPGVQGPKARCYLKTHVPGSQRNACCVSGVKER
jgi:hypothetical protein